ncbi:MAG: hypothetical protein ACRDBX_02565 [Erysipelotrichaceae bacterium]
MEFVYAIVFFALMGGFYALVYTLNRKTPLPQGCEDLASACTGCKDFACGHNPTHKE